MGLSTLCFDWQLELHACQLCACSSHKGGRRCDDVTMLLKGTLTPPACAARSGLEGKACASSVCVSVGPFGEKPPNLTGTTAFTSPEYARQDAHEYLDACSQDMWAAGVLAVFMFTGCCPFHCHDLANGEPDWQDLRHQHNLWVCSSPGVSMWILHACSTCKQLQCLTAKP